MKKRRTTTAARKMIGVFCLGLLILAAAYYLPFSNGLFGNRARGKLAALGLMLTVGMVWMLYRERTRN